MVLKRDVITVFLEEGLFVGRSKIYNIGVKNKKKKVDLIYVPIHIKNIHKLTQSSEVPQNSRIYV